MTPGPPATEDVFGQLATMRVIPVVVLDDSAAAAPLTDAGLPCAEITLRTAAGEAAIRPGTGTRYDLVSLGEVMLRLDPGESRIRNSRSFTAWEGRRGVQRRPRAGVGARADR